MGLRPIADGPLQEEVNYFPSRFDAVRHAAKTPAMVSTEPISGVREKAMLEKENNFQQAGERFRSFDPDRCVVAGAVMGLALVVVARFASVVVWCWLVLR